MSYFIQKEFKSKKTNFISRFFLYSFFSLAILLFFMPVVSQDLEGALFLATPISLPIAGEQKPVSKKVSVITQKVVPKSPEAHLIIPKIHVDAVIEEMGITPDGAMAVPDNRIDVGWFSYGTRPGEKGSAVIGGHNRFDSQSAVFNDLDQLEKGDIISVVDKKGVSTSFVVRDIRTFDAGNKDTGIFESKDGIHLNLITCSGLWDPSTKSSLKRLVIFTDVVELATESDS